MCDGACVSVCVCIYECVRVYLCVLLQMCVCVCWGGGGYARARSGIKAEVE